MRSSTQRYLLAILASIIMAYLSAHYLWGGSVWNIIPWGLLVVGGGLMATTKRQAWRLGAILGFTISYCFLWFDNTDRLSLHQFLQLLLLIPLPSLFGALCGTLTSRLAFAIKRLRVRSSH